VIDGPLDLLRRLVDLFDDIGVRYVLGGSMAAAMIGEPRSTVDVDVAISVDAVQVSELLARLSDDYYLPREAAAEALSSGGSFNVVDTASSLKAHLFVLGDGVLDRRQIERRVRLDVDGFADGLWVTAPEDQVLRKLDWYRRGDERSDRQWRDVLAILRVQGTALDLHDLREVADEVGLTALVDRALSEAEAV